MMITYYDEQSSDCRDDCHSPEEIGEVGSDVVQIRVISDDDRCDEKTKSDTQLIAANTDRRRGRQLTRVEPLGGQSARGSQYEYLGTGDERLPDESNPETIGLNGKNFDPRAQTAERASEYRCPPQTDPLGDVGAGDHEDHVIQHVRHRGPIDGQRRHTVISGKFY